MKRLLYILISSIAAMACTNGENKSNSITASTASSDSLISFVNKDSLAADSTTGKVDDQLPEPQDTTALNILMDSIFKLPEVQKVHKQILNATGDKHGVSLMTVANRNKPGEYEIKAGFNGEIRFENRITFMVDVSTMAIKVEDTKTGNLLTLEEYQKPNP